MWSGELAAVTLTTPYPLAYSPGWCQPELKIQVLSSFMTIRITGISDPLSI